uniref:Uncharacterized protein n=1 Tax=Zonotrichia albicollis TaxID=44394 RepID=A0A8D2MQK9_ZONAL
MLNVELIRRLLGKLWRMIQQLQPSFHVKQQWRGPQYSQPCVPRQLGKVSKQETLKSVLVKFFQAIHFSECSFLHSQQHPCTLPGSLQQPAQPQLSVTVLPCLLPSANTGASLSCRILSKGSNKCSAERKLTFLLAGRQWSLQCMNKVLGKAQSTKLIFSFPVTLCLKETRSAPSAPLAGEQLVLSFFCCLFGNQKEQFSERKLIVYALIIAACGGISPGAVQGDTSFGTSAKASQGKQLPCC